MSTKHGDIKSFTYAITGIKTAIKEEPNLKVHLILAVLAIIMGIFLNINPTEWSILAIAIVTVIVLEFINTSIEAIVDLVSPKIAHKAKVAKDVAAGAVLVAALSAVIIGIAIFAPKIL